MPVQVTTITGITKIVAGFSQSLALKEDGTVWAWGSGGVLGNGTGDESHVPVQVSALTDITDIDSGEGFFLALKSDGTVWAWGGNLNGELGNGNTTNSYVPVQSGSISTAVAIAAGYNHSIALLEDGTVRTWGHNYDGELGIGNLIDSHVPVQPATLSDVYAIAAGTIFSVFLKNNGSVWTTGTNLAGELGDGTTVQKRSTPVQVVSLCQVGTGLSEPLHVTGMDAFPNPTSGRLTVEVPTQGVQRVQVRDVMGKEVHRATFNGTRVAIDLTAQPSGIYFLTIGMLTQKVVKE